MTQACNALLNKDCPVALAGGVSVVFPSVSGYIHEEGNVFIREKGRGTSNYVIFMTIRIYSPKMVTAEFLMPRLVESYAEMELALSCSSALRMLFATGL